MADNLSGYRTALRLLKERQVASVVGLGGYASVPLARAAVRSRVPLALLEQNATAGRATQWLARSATVVCAAFEGTALPPRFAGALHSFGNPVRRDFLRHCYHKDENKKPHRRKQLLVLGGSSGARTLNQHLPTVLSKLQPHLSDWNIVHQSGWSELDSTKSLYDRLGMKAAVVPFLSNMPKVLAKTGLAVCRAGGTTLAELAVSRVPAILVPYPYAAHDHQRRNADVFSSAGASLILDEREHNGRLDDRLSAVLSNLLSNEASRAKMSEAMGRLARPEAARCVAGLVAQLAASRTVRCS
jgi:UDP-N-acetylglucosamine--N-acetylmuramyl-(pentapeptide) pyrophosphoryl-undecaprenol N-acetylglucosamine transferase